MDYAFSGCRELRSVEYQAVNPIKIVEDVFDNDVYKKATLYVPIGSIRNYVSAIYWNHFANILESGFEDGVETITSEDVEAEYYTLQGVRVANPIPGQLYIVRKGNSTCKMVVK